MTGLKSIVGDDCAIEAPAFTTWELVDVSMAQAIDHFKAEDFDAAELAIAAALGHADVSPLEVMHEMPGLVRLAGIIARALELRGRDCTLSHEVKMRALDLQEALGGIAEWGGGTTRGCAEREA